MAGWIKLHRSLLDSAVFNDAQLLKLWIWCLLKASHTPREIVVEKQLVRLEPGQFVTGRFKLEEEFNRDVVPRHKVSGLTLWRWLRKLESWQMLNIKTHSKFSIIAVSNWDEYQQDEQQMNNRRTTDEQQMNNRRTTDEQQTNTNKNDKNEKNDKKDLEKETSAFHQEVVDIYHSICVSLPTVRKLTSKRKSLINARLKDLDNLDGFKHLFEKVQASSFLTGNNDRGWRADFDWVLNDSNCTKILEGRYDNRSESRKITREDFTYKELPKPNLEFFTFLQKEGTHE